MAVHCIILLLLSIILCLIPIHLSIRILRSNFISEHVEFSILLSSVDSRQHSAATGANYRLQLKAMLAVNI